MILMSGRFWTVPSSCQLANADKLIYFGHKSTCFPTITIYEWLCKHVYYLARKTILTLSSHTGSKAELIFDTYKNRTFTIICDNDLIPLPYLQKTTIWSGRIFFIWCYLGYLLAVCIVLLSFISPFQCICWKLSILCSIVFVRMLMSCFAFVRPK